ncbi:MAG: hypothetical protein Q7T03_03680, partial [Deltaproteobacteria bacterium]|nr:hypothetical protein [Deltaproteobacteria bacterium]
MSNREYQKPAKVAPMDIGRLTQAFKTPERLWMSILLINQCQETPTVQEFSTISGLSVGLISKFANILRESGFLASGQ